jgi:hypothetical protein
MTVIDFPRNRHGSARWRASELDRLLPPCAAEIAQAGSNSGFAVGATEDGSPQLYVLGPPPDYECVLCITRIGSLYIMEDGAGRIILEHTNLMTIAEQIPAAISRRKAALAAKFTLLWAAVRQQVEEKIEPMLAEPMELATHFAPQLAAFG